MELFASISPPSPLSSPSSSPHSFFFHFPPPVSAISEMTVPLSTPPLFLQLPFSLPLSPPCLCIHYAFAPPLFLPPPAFIPESPPIKPYTGRIEKMGKAEKEGRGEKRTPPFSSGAGFLLTLGGRGRRTSERKRRSMLRIRSWKRRRREVTFIWRGGISFTEDEGEGRRLFLRAAEEGRTPTEDIGEVEERKSDLESVKGALELVEGESEEELFTNHQQRSKYSPRFHDASVSCSPDPSTILSIVSFSHSIAFSAHPSTGIKLSWERVVVVVVDRAGNQSFRLSPSFSIYRRRSPVPSQTATRDFPSPFPLRLRRERFLYAAAALYSQEAREGGYGEVSIFLFQDLSTSSSSTEEGAGLANRREEERRSASLHLHSTPFSPPRGGGGGGENRRRRTGSSLPLLLLFRSPHFAASFRERKKKARREREGIRVRKRVGWEDPPGRRRRKGWV